MMENLRFEIVKELIATGFRAFTDKELETLLSRAEKIAEFVEFGKTQQAAVEEESAVIIVLV